MRIATWNVNSIRSRIDRLEAWVTASGVDVLAIQETKTNAEQFESVVAGRVRDLGFESVHHGYNHWNGVAILSRVGIEDVQRGFPDAPQWGDPPREEARCLSAVCGGVRVTSVYVPNGRNLQDPHMDYKVAWLAGLRDQARVWADDDAQVAIMGDWNIAPLDEDVWSMEFYEPRSHVSPRERAGFQAVLDVGYADVVRPHAPGPGTYTYWDYQHLRFAKRQGMRIDFVLATPSLADRVLGAAIDREERKGKGASDHAPVVVELGG